MKKLLMMVVFLVFPLSASAEVSMTIKYKYDKMGFVTILNPFPDDSIVQIMILKIGTNESIPLLDKNKKKYSLTEGTGDGRVDLNGERFEFLVDIKRFEVVFFRPNNFRDSLRYPCRFVIDLREP